MKRRSWLRLDWDAVAGVLAAVAALLLHFLHVIETDLLLSIALVLLALLLVRDLRRETQHERVLELAAATESAVVQLREAVRPPDVTLVGPRRLRAESDRFARRARGEMVWFHVCLSMFRPQDLFDALLRPALENPHVSAVRFVLDRSEKARWQEHVVPKVRSAPGGEKVAEPVWCRIDEAVSFILSETDGGGTEALLSFWGEPFMARTTRAVPRYIFHVRAHSELIGRLSEIERGYRLGEGAGPAG